MLRAIGNKENYQHFKRRLFFKLNSGIFLSSRHKSHYSALGLEKNASLQDIKSAYYKLSLQYHPDKNQGSAESVEKFREITSAYEVLSNQNKKKSYDESLKYPHPYSESEWRREHYSPRSYPYKQSKPRTGRSEYYNYDEHYKQHYGDYEKQRQADYEYFKHRWEADFRRRYPFGGKPDWSEYERQQEQQEMDWRDLLPKKYLMYFLSMFVAMFILSYPFMEEPPTPLKKPKKTTTPIYYKIKRHEEEDEDSSKN